MIHVLVRKGGTTRRPASQAEAVIVTRVGRDHVADPAVGLGGPKHTSLAMLTAYRIGRYSRRQGADYRRRSRILFCIEDVRNVI
jgi:hypothetical protein